MEAAIGRAPSSQAHKRPDDALPKSAGRIFVADSAHGAANDLTVTATQMTIKTTYKEVARAVQEMGAELNNPPLRLFGMHGDLETSHEELWVVPRTGNK